MRAKMSTYFILCNESFRGGNLCQESSLLPLALVVHVAVPECDVVDITITNGSDSQSNATCSYSLKQHVLRIVLQEKVLFFMDSLRDF